MNSIHIQKAIFSHTVIQCVNAAFFLYPDIHSVHKLLHFLLYYIFPYLQFTLDTAEN